MSVELVNLEQLKHCCKKPLEYWFKKYEHVSGKTGRYIYIKRGAPILAVAHLDAVAGKGFHFNHYTRNGIDIIKTPTLDDRLGVYTILYLLPQLLGEGWADILLTEGEEVGRSTAKDFVTDVEYNWIVEFDRKESSLTGGDDVVLYEYADPDTRKLMADNEFKVGNGSVSDISYMEDIGVKAFNFAVGYRDYHSQRAWFMPAEYEHNIKKFVKFYERMKDTRLPHVKKPRYTYTYPTTYNRASYTDRLAGCIVYHYRTSKNWKVLHSNEKGMSLINDKRKVIWASHNEVVLAAWACTVCFGYSSVMYTVGGNAVCENCYNEAFQPCLNCGGGFIGGLVDGVCSQCKEWCRLEIGDVVQYIRGTGTIWIVEKISPILLTLVTEDGIEAIVNRIDYPDWKFIYLGTEPIGDNNNVSKENKQEHDVRVSQDKGMSPGL